MVAPWSGLRSPQWHPRLAPAFRLRRSRRCARRRSATSRRQERLDGLGLPRCHQGLRRSARQGLLRWRRQSLAWSLLPHLRSSRSLSPSHNPGGGGPAEGGVAPGLGAQGVGPPRGVLAPGAMPYAAAATSAAPPLPAHLVAKSQGPWRYGDPVPLPPGTAVSSDGKAVIAVNYTETAFAQYATEASYQEFMDGAVADDVRILPIRRSAGASRTRSWASLAEDSRAEAFGDWPIAGPRSTAWCLEFLKREGRSLELHHERFKQVARVDGGAWGSAEHAELCNILEYLGLYDQVDMANLVGIEAIFRRLQTIEFSYFDKVQENQAKAMGGGKLSLEEQALFGGLSRSSAALTLAPQLMDYVRTEAEKNASLAKNFRKARQERDEKGKK